MLYWLFYMLLLCNSNFRNTVMMFRMYYSVDICLQELKSWKERLKDFESSNYITTTLQVTYYTPQSILVIQYSMPQVPVV